ncbi:helix-turn-helix domain-containing protein [Tellurirhabdus bombi]|uniref:helix-turn-helix domain-containing protein n=1 Tax=Tellurirhabdus bombi TaxID=2907205 RepID=UPI001F3983D2|nr:helix-turn-helix domain-containing protein [Tellurirhabdus bombi]
MSAVNEKLELAYNFVLHTSRNVFLTGKAGTGKTTFLHQIKQTASKRLAVVAPTGVAAINAGGVTIHSLFQLPFGPLTPGSTQRESKKFNKEKINLLRTLDLLIIDEISMVRADVLDGIDEVLRRYRHRSEPFGGVQLLLIGDMQQLPPVIKDEDWSLLQPHYETGYFFGSRALQDTPYISIELTHIYRQSDERFINILNGIREKTVTRSQLDELNRRYIPEFAPDDAEGYITLSTHNSAAQQINSQKLQSLTTRLHQFEAVIEGEFPTHAYPTEASLELKVGAQVMFIKNDISREKLYYNGKIGRITAVDNDFIYVKGTNERDEIAVSPAEWSNIRYSLDPETKEIKSEPIGRFLQYPLRLAWAITIHKSQGLTFEKAIIDASAAFAHGQVYVALSRCKSLEGIVLRAPIPSHSIKTELRLENFHEQVQQQIPTAQELHDSRRTNQEALLQELFSFERADYLIAKCGRVARENSGSLDDGLNPALEQLQELLREKASKMTYRFLQQLPAYFADDSLPEENQILQERVRKAGAYFQMLLQNELLPALQNCPTDCDNKQVRSILTEAIVDFEKELFSKLRCFECSKEGFEALAYLKARNRAELDFQTAKVGKETDSFDDTGSTHKTLYKALAKWRDDLAGENDVSGYMVLPRKTLLELVRILPTTSEELLTVKGFGKTKVKQIGNEVLAIIRTYCDSQRISKERVVTPKKKEPKIPSSAISLALLRQGKTPSEIATERNMALSTIENHLAHAVSSGELAIEEALPAEKITLIRTYLDEYQPTSMTAVKMALGEDVSYGDIRLVFNAIRTDSDQ